MAHVSTPSSSTLPGRKPAEAGAWVERLGWTVALAGDASSRCGRWPRIFVGSRHLAGTRAVLDVLLREAASGALWQQSAHYALRVAAAFTIAMFIGAAIGIAVGSNKLADRFFDSWLILFLNLPALVIIALCYVWLGTDRGDRHRRGGHQQDPERRRADARRRAQPVQGSRRDGEHLRLRDDGRRCAT